MLTFANSPVERLLLVNLQTGLVYGIFPERPSSTFLCVCGPQLSADYFVVNDTKERLKSQNVDLFCHEIVSFSMFLNLFCCYSILNNTHKGESHGINILSCHFVFNTSFYTKQCLHNYSTVFCILTLASVLSTAGLTFSISTVG